MYYTHYFANHETLARARTWLSRVGFGVESIEIHVDGIPRITVAVNPTHWSGVEMLINAIERSDPCGWPGYWDVANQAHVYPKQLMFEAKIETTPSGATAIGWHPVDQLSAIAQEQEVIDSMATTLRERWS
jgi:hypothetical protein